MTDEAKKKRNEYMSKWRKDNKDKVKANNERYWEKKVNKEVNINEE